MPRLARVDLPHYPYHIINRAVMRLQIFTTDKDYQMFERVLEHAADKISMRILAYAVMPNHWHLLLYPQQAGDLALFMHQLTSTHTRKVKSTTKTEGTGPLYQGRYKSFIVQDDPHFLTVLKYIERNPVRAGLVKRAEDWRWGSAWRRVYGTEQQKNLLSGAPVALPKNYVEWVNTIESPTELEEVRKSVNKGAPYGNETWVEKTVAQFNLGPTLNKPGRPKK